MLPWFPGMCCGAYLGAGRWLNGMLGVPQVPCDRITLDAGCPVVFVHCIFLARYHNVWEVLVVFVKIYLHLNMFLNIKST